MAREQTQKKTHTGIVTTRLNCPSAVQWADLVKNAVFSFVNARSGYVRISYPKLFSINIVIK